MHPHASVSYKPGYVLLLGVLIICVVVLQLTIIGLYHSVRERQTYTAFNNKRISRIVTKGCMEHAINSLGRLSGYAGNESYAIAGNTCSILPITTNAGTWTLKVSTTIGQQTTRVLTILSSRAPVVIYSWQEVTAFP